MLSSHCENILAYAAARRREAVLVDPRRYRPKVEVAPNCPRCDSPNTKFCYYNNYSLSQPRYFCKGCHRYWTKGGSLRNVPVGGGCRKNRRGKSARSMVDSDTVADATPAGASFSHRFHGHVRPDMLLEGMVGSPAGLGQHSASVDRPTAADGSTIDLAFLYSKFLTHEPPIEQCAAVVAESADTFSGSSAADMSPPDAMQPSVPSGPSQHGLGKLLWPASKDPSSASLLQCGDDARYAHQVVGELNFSVDAQSCYESLGLATDGSDLIPPSTSWGQNAKYETFDSLPEHAMSLHDIDVWSSALVFQGLDAALCRT